MITILGIGGGGGLMALRAPEDAVAKAAKTEAKLEDHEKRLGALEMQGVKVAQDISDMKSDLRIVRVLLERSDPKAKVR